MVRLQRRQSSVSRHIGNPVDSSTPIQPVSTSLTNDELNNSEKVSGNVSYESSHGAAKISSLVLLSRDSDGSDVDYSPSSLKFSPEVEKMTQLELKKALGTKKNLEGRIEKKHSVSMRRSARSRSRSRQRIARKPTPPRTEHIFTNGTSMISPLNESAFTPSPKLRRSTRLAEKPIEQNIFKNTSDDSLRAPTSTPNSPSKSFSFFRGDYFAEHPMLLSSLHFVVCIVYALVLIKIILYFEVDQFVLRHWRKLY